MSGTLNINIVANAGNTPATMNNISQSVAQLNAELTKAGLSAKGFSAQLNQTAAGLNLVSVSARATEQGMNNVAHASTGVVRELVVIGHEAMSGRFSRIPGSLMVMTEYMGGLSTATLGLVAAFAAAALGAAHLVEWLGRINAAKLSADAAGSYFNTGASSKQIESQVDALRQLRGVSTEEAGKIVTVFAGMRNATADQIGALSRITLGYAQATGESVDSAAKSLRQAFEEPTEAGRRLLSTLQDGAKAVAKFDEITGDTAPAQRRLLILNELTAAENRRLNDRRAPGAVDDMSDVSWITAHQQQDQDAFNQQVAKARNNISNEDVAGPKNQETWFEKQQTGADALRDKIISTATSYKSAMQKANEALAEYWKNVSEHATVGSKDQARATEEYLRYKDAAELQSMRIGQQNVDSTLKTQLASLNAQQAAAGENKDQVMALEQQKLDLLAQYGRTGTAQYEQELQHRAELINKFNREEESERIKAVSSEIEADNKAYRNKEATLKAEVQARAVSVSDADSQLASLSQQQLDAELTDINNLISSLAQGTKAYENAIAERKKILEDFSARQARLNDAQIVDAGKAATGTEKAFDTAFDSIASTGENAFQRLIARQESFARAGLNMAGSVISAFANLCAQMAARWLAMELANSATTSTQAAVRAAQENGGSGLSVLISKTLAQWLGLETAKTAITGSGAATQTAVVAAANASQTATTAAAQTAQVAAVTAGGAAKVTATASAATASKATQTAINGPTVMADAAKAAAGAYASVAQIPLVGWLLAPAAAAAAFAAVGAYQSLASFDTGAYNLPSDMIAQVHKGEMIIPAAQASQLRASMDSGYNIASFAPNVGGARSRFDSFSSSNNQQANFSFVQNLAIHGAPGSSLGGSASQLLSRSKRDAESMFWSMARNGALKPRNI